MKKLITLTCLGLSLQIMASCPNLAGIYKCSSDTGSYEMVITQTDQTFEIKDDEGMFNYTADGISRMQKMGEFEGVVNATCPEIDPSLFIAADGYLSDNNGQSISARLNLIFKPIGAGIEIKTTIKLSPLIEIEDQEYCVKYL